MTRCAVLFALVFALVATTGCQQKPFTEFNSPDGKFKAIFPGEPKITSTAGAGVTIKMYAVESWSKSYMLAWSDVPIPEWESEGKTKSRLFDARDGAIAAVKGKSSGTTKVIHLEDRFPGVEFGGTAEGKYLRARAYIVGRRMYQLLVIARSQEDLTSTEAEDFFAAFQVFDAESLFPPGKPVPTAPEPEMFPVESNVGRFQANYPLRPARFTRTVGRPLHGVRIGIAERLVLGGLRRLADSWRGAAGEDTRTARHGTKLGTRRGQGHARGQQGSYDRQRSTGAGVHRDRGETSAWPHLPHRGSLVSGHDPRHRSVRDLQGSDHVPRFVPTHREVVGRGFYEPDA